VRGFAARASLLAVLLAPAGVCAQGFHPGDAVRVNGVAISYQRFNGFYQEYRVSKGVAAGARGDQLELFKKLRREAMDLLVDQEVVRQAAERAGVPVEESEVDAGVAKLRSVFKTPEAYAARLEAEGFNEESYRKHVRGMIAAAKYLDGIREAVPPVTDAELAEYYRQNERRLTFPEEVRLRQILLLWNPSGKPDDRAAVRARMAPILEQARAGADFAELARRHSEDSTAKAGGDTGFIRRGENPPAFDNAAFALATGEVSGMVETHLGVHVIRLEERRPAHLVPLDEVHERLRDHVRKERMDAAAKKEVERLRAAADVAVLIPL
jgi:peptidyl-prolyl cis-trans isomerase C